MTMRPTALLPVTCTHDSPLGTVLLAATDDALVGLWFEGQRHWPAAAASWPRSPGHPVIARAIRALDAYFAGEGGCFDDLCLRPYGGTPFQHRVWEALRGIPRGRTLSYGALATQLGHSAAVRAVGAAVGRNPLSIVVPCHRVVGKSGALTGYAGGLQRKTALLRLEGALD